MKYILNNICLALLALNFMGSHVNASCDCQQCYDAGCGCIGGSACVCQCTDANKNFIPKKKRPKNKYQY